MWLSYTCASQLQLAVGRRCSKIHQYHVVDKYYKTCSFMGYICVQASPAKVPAERAASRVGQVTCHGCGKVFASRNSLSNHKRARCSTVAKVRPTQACSARQTRKRVTLRIFGPSPYMSSDKKTQKSCQVHNICFIAKVGCTEIVAVACWE